MAKARTDGVKKKRVFPKVIKIAVIVLVIAGLAGGGLYAYRNMSKKTSTTTYVANKVKRGDIQLTISGSGSIKPIDQYTVTSLAKGQVLTCNFNEGDKVEKGSLLYTIDSSDAVTDIDKAKLALEKQQMAYDQSVKALDDLNIKANIGGRVTDVYVEKGDTVQSGAKLADVIDNTTMVLKIPFNASDAGRISEGESADVTLDSTYETIKGTVNHVYQNDYVASGNMHVRDVEIYVKNPGAIAKGATATAAIGGIACNSSGSFSYLSEGTITASASGEISSLYLEEGEKIYKDQLVAVLKNDTLTNNLKNSELSLHDANLSLDNLNEQLENYSIKAPISGTVIEKDVKAGDKLDTNSTTTMAVIADMSQVYFEIDVDELDIAQIEVGQKATITADALEGKTFTGTVTYKSIIGTSSDGVASYPIKITLDDGTGLLPGMNVNASIVVKESKNALLIPSAAVQRGNMVLVKDNSVASDKSNSNKNSNSDSSEKAAFANGQPTESQNGSTGTGIPSASSRSQTGQDSSQTSKGSSGTSPSNSQGSKSARSFLKAPDGYKYVHVTLGINNDTYIEVTDGLTEGEEVYTVVTKTTESKTTTSNSQSSGMTGFGGMGGMGGMGGPGMYSGSSNRSSTRTSSSSGSSSSTKSTSLSGGSSGSSSSTTRSSSSTNSSGGSR